MAEKRKALGRGISSLIRKHPNVIAKDEGQSQNNKTTELNTVSDKKDGLNHLSLSEIKVNPRQPRRYFKDEALQDLKRSIIESGVLQPILVRKIEDGYELIAGERRFRASKLAGKKTIPALIKTMNDQTQLEVAIVENLQRDDLTAIEEAKAYERLSIEFALSQEEIAKKVGKNRSTVTNLMRLLKLSPIVQAFVNEGKLSMGHARALLGLNSAMDQERIAHKVIKGGLSVRSVENMVKQNQVSGHKPNKIKQKISLNPNLKFVQDTMQRNLGTKVEIRPSGKGGELSIKYFSSEDLQRLNKLFS